jgi:hypothetical protein
MRAASDPARSFPGRAAKQITGNAHARTTALLRLLTIGARRQLIGSCGKVALRIGDSQVKVTTGWVHHRRMRDCADVIVATCKEQ